MNFSNSYIEMVINNKQIQDLCKYKKGNWFIDFGDMPKKYGKGRFEVLSRELNYNNNLFKYFRENTKWLPTLEDLFGIAKPIFSRTALELNYVVIGDKVEVLIGKCDSEGCGLDIEFTATSLETGLLRAIMAYEYNKSWNGKEWEEINGS